MQRRCQTKQQAQILIHQSPDRYVGARCEDESGWAIDSQPRVSRSSITKQWIKRRSLSKR